MLFWIKYPLRRTSKMIQSCVHAPKCNNEVKKNGNKFVVCPGLDFTMKLSKIKSVINHNQMKSKESPEQDFLRWLKETKKNKKKIKEKQNKVQGRP